MSQIKELTANKLKVKIFPTRFAMGMEAANDVSEKIKQLLQSQEQVNIIFAAAPSQDEFLFSLSKDESIDWSRVNAFHMDEYVGLNENAPQLFGQFLKAGIFGKVPFNEVHYLNGNEEDIDVECQRYTGLLNQYPADIVCMGIGENAHIAFNDPHNADFNDPLLVKEVTLDEVSRQQQVNDGCFNNIEDVPKSAITLSVPALVRAKNIFCMVPGSNKAEAVFHTFNSEIKEDFPSTILKKHNNAILYLDADSAARI